MALEDSGINGSAVRLETCHLASIVSLIKQSLGKHICSAINSFIEFLVSKIRGLPYQLLTKILYNREENYFNFLKNTDFNLISTDKNLFYFFKHEFL